MICSMLSGSSASSVSSMPSMTTASCFFQLVLLRMSANSCSHLFGFGFGFGFGVRPVVRARVKVRFSVGA